MNDSVELRVARLVTSTLIMVGLATSILGVIALVGWVF